MSAMSFRRRSVPSGFESSTISPNSSGVWWRPRYFIVYWNAFWEFSPSVPVADSMFCSASAAVTSDGMSLYWAITSGFSQTRIEYSAPRVNTSPTPRIRWMRGSTLIFR